MKENKEKTVMLLEEGSPGKISPFKEEKKSIGQRFKKPLIMGLMGIVFIGCMFLIFKPSADKKETENIGLNNAVPQPAEAVMQADKQKAYEQEILEEKEQLKRNAMTSLSDYWNEESTGQEPASDQEEQKNSYGGSPSRPGSPALNSYRNAQSTLGSFYQDDNSQTKELRRQVDELREKLAEKEVPAAVTVDEQLKLMEKSYQMAAKYLPSTANSGESTGKNVSLPAASAVGQKPYFTSFTPARKSKVSALHRALSDSTFSAVQGESINRSFYTAASGQDAVKPGNSVKACVEQTQTIIGEGSLRMRLLEPAQIPDHTIAAGTILTAAARIQAGRLQLKISSIELNGSIIPVEIIIYDLDGQQGLSIPYSAEMNALTEMAGNMSQQSGTSLMMTQSAGQQVAADLSRGVVQGISGYFSKKVRAQKVTLKAGHQVFLVSKK